MTMRTSQVGRALLEADGFESSARVPTETARFDVYALRPEVVLDIQLTDMDGFAVASRLAEAGDAPAVVLISSAMRRVRASPA